MSYYNSPTDVVLASLGLPAAINVIDDAVDAAFNVVETALTATQTTLSYGTDIVDGIITRLVKSPQGLVSLIAELSVIGPANVREIMNLPVGYLPAALSGVGLLKQGGNLFLFDWSASNNWGGSFANNSLVISVRRNLAGTSLGLPVLANGDSIYINAMWSL